MHDDYVDNATHLSDDLYPASFGSCDSIAYTLRYANYRSTLEETDHELVGGEERFGPFRLSGRLHNIRSFGKLIFVDLVDYSGKIQLSLRRDNVGSERHALFRKKVNTGDYVSVLGVPYTTKKGEPTIEVSEFAVVAKNFHLLPTKDTPQQDEVRWRNREVDAITNRDTMNRIRFRSSLIRETRRHLEHPYQGSFIEIDTPILQHMAGGANARPFVTHHHDMDADLQLRIAPELFLKRALVMGFKNVYEVARSFRNESMDRQHLQDFTLVEWYAAGDDMWKNLDRFTALLSRLNDMAVSLNPEWGSSTYSFSMLERHRYMDLISDAIGFSPMNLTVEEIRSRISIPNDSEGINWSKAVDNLFKAHVRPNLIEPCIVYEYPADMAPLARPCDDNPALVDMWQMVWNGFEVAKCYNELVDPVAQREALEAQVGDDPEAMPYDTQFVRALELGCPPCSGLGFGVERLVALFTASDNIRESVPFPLLAQEGSHV